MLTYNSNCIAVEIKTGYGLTVEAELKMLKVIIVLKTGSLKYTISSRNILVIRILFIKRNC